MLLFFTLTLGWNDLSSSSFHIKTLAFTCNLTLTQIRLVLLSVLGTWSMALVLVLAGPSVGPSPGTRGILLLVPTPFSVPFILLLVRIIFLVPSS